MASRSPSPSSTLGSYGYRGRYDSVRRASASSLISPGSPLRSAPTRLSPLPGRGNEPDGAAASAYLQHHRVMPILQELTEQLILERPANPVLFMAKALFARTSEGAAYFAAATAASPSRLISTLATDSSDGLLLPLHGSGASGSVPPHDGARAHKRNSPTSRSSSSSRSGSRSVSSDAAMSEMNSDSESAVQAERPAPTSSAATGAFVHSHNVTESTMMNASDPDSDEVFVNQYRLGELLGKGMQGEVFRVQDSRDGNAEYALKIVRAGTKVKKMLRRPPPAPPGADAKSLVKSAVGANPMHEIAVLKKLSHPNIVKLKEVIMDNKADRVYLVLELLSFGSVLSGVPPNQGLDLQAVFIYTRDIVLGLEYLHAQGVVHRDLKPDNLLIDRSGVIKIADFGVAQVFDGSEASLLNSQGTPAYFAPELCGTTGTMAGKAIDLWALGVCVFQFVFGVLPFEPLTSTNPFHAQKVLFADICSKEPAIPAHASPIDPALMALLMSLLAKDPKTRATCRSLRSDPWLTKNGTAPLREQTEPRVHVTYGEVDSAVTRGMLKTSRVVLAIKTMFTRRLKRAATALDSASREESPR